MIGQTLGHYRILEKIGEGGMGVVYRAHDVRLERDVAVKVLPAGLLADEAAQRRFRKEALALAKLTHPNIAAVYDVGEQDGVDYLVLECVPGQTLAEKLKTASLPEKEVLSLGAQIAAALEEAHEHSVVHRDLKPGNIVVTPRGQAKVLDFGLARLLRPVGDGSTTDTVSAGQDIAGTLPYMPPEQLQGAGVDVRSDLYAVGALLYETATGRRAFPEKTAPELIGAILQRPPLQPRSVNAKVSPELERVILKCLEKDPENRYQSAKELGVDLRRLAAPVSASARRVPTKAGIPWGIATAGLAAVALLAMLFGLNVGGWRDRLLGRGDAPRIESLAVLPLENVTHDPEQEYFADGMTDELITQLAKISALRVISRTSVMRYKGSKKSLPEIARDLNVDAVLQGSVRRVGGHVRVTAQLIRAASDTHVWANDYDRSVSDVLTLQSELARAIAKEIRIQVTPQVRARLVAAHTVNPDAYEAYLQGRYHSWKLNEEDLKKSIEYFERAIRLDPDFAAAFAGLSRAWGDRGIFGAAPFRDVEPQSRAAALKALELDKDLAEGHAALADIKFEWDWDWSGSEKEYRRAIELDPNSLEAHHGYAFFLHAMGRFPEAIVEMAKCKELDPLNSTVESGYGRILYRARRYQEAIPHLQRAIELDLRDFAAYGRLADVYEELGRLNEAIELNEKAEALRGTGAHSRYSAALARLYALTGRRARALKMLGGLKAEHARYGQAQGIAQVCAALGDNNEAFAWLEKALEDRTLIALINTEPKFDSLRSDPRWLTLLRRIGLPP